MVPVQKTMELLGIKVLSSTENLGDISNPNDFLVELINVGLGQHMVLQTRQKSRAGINIRASQGKFCGGIPPLGYDIQDGDYIINEREAEAVRLIFEMYAAGKSYNNIIDLLQSKGIRSKKGNLIGKNAIYEILRNERYKGTYSWNKRNFKKFGKWAGGKGNPDATILEDKIPPIIDKVLWERVKRRMDENKVNKMNKSRVKREYMLSGLLRCAKCGGAFVGVTTTNKKKNNYEYRFYTCANKRRLRNCDCKNIVADELETFVVMMMRADILNEKMLEETAELIVGQVNQDSPDKRKAAIDKEIAAINVKINNLFRSIETGFDSDLVRDRIRYNQDQIKKLEEQKERISPYTLVDKERLMKELRKDAMRLKEDRSCVKELIRKYVLKIEIDDDTITIHAVDDLNTIGCGGTKQAAIKYIASRVNNKLVNIT